MIHQLSRAHSVYPRSSLFCLVLLRSCVFLHVGTVVRIVRYSWPEGSDPSAFSHIMVSFVFWQEEQVDDVIHVVVESVFPGVCGSCGQENILDQPIGLFFGSMDQWLPFSQVSKAPHPATSKKDKSTGRSANRLKSHVPRFLCLPIMESPPAQFRRIQEISCIVCSPPRSCAARGFCHQFGSLAGIVFTCTGQRILASRS